MENMFFDFLSIAILIALSILSVLFFLEKKKNQEKFSESHQNLITNVTQINNVISKNQDELHDKLSEQHEDTVVMFQEERKISQEFEDSLERKIKLNFDRFGFTAREKFEAMEKKVIENNDNLLKFTASAREDHKELQTNTSKNFQVLTDQLLAQAALISKLRADNEELRKKLAIFTEIGADSKQLNEDIDLEEEERKIQEATLIFKSMSQDKKTDQPVEIHPTNEQSSSEIRQHAKDDLIVETTLDKSLLDPDQMRALSLMENTTENYFITGKAGTGKSYLLKVFENGTGKKTLKVSPTGISALNIGGTTIHSAFGFSNLVNLNVEDINYQTIRLRSEKRYVLQEIDTLIIDEISMIRADTFDKMDRILRVVNNNNNIFGGKQVVAFGDLFQLPPIANSAEESFLRQNYGGIFFFNSEAYKDGKFNFMELGTNHRQKQDQYFFEMLNRMREGGMNDSDISIINERVNMDDDDLRRIVRLFPTKKEVNKVNKLELSKIAAREYTFDAKVLEQKYINQNFSIDKNFPINFRLKLRLGALVMIVKNDPGRRWANGTLAIVSFISDDVIKVTINDIEYELHKATFETREAKLVNDRIEYEVVFQVEQYPIILGYALTIHKSQGQTYKELACDLTDCFAPGQAYVALSRCSTLDGLHLLKEIDGRHIEVDSEVREFYVNAR